MDEAVFWRLIEAAKAESRGDVDVQARRLEAELKELSAEEIVAFDELFEEMMDRLYRYDLWAGAYILNGGCSDDCFDYFRGWLIAQGAQVFNDALRNPKETLLRVVDPRVVDRGGIEGELMLSVASGAYEAKVGREMPWRDRPRRELEGEEWDEETLDTLFPRLVARFG